MDWGRGGSDYPRREARYEIATSVADVWGKVAWAFKEAKEVEEQVVTTPEGSINSGMRVVTESVVT